MTVCVDASLVIKWLIPEEGTDQALLLYERWRNENRLLIAPSLIDYEIGSTLRKKVLRGAIKTEDLFAAFDFYKRSGLLLFHLTELVEQAVSAAAALDQPTIYDIAYLLTAKQQKADYVTADKRFYEKAHSLFSFVRFYEDLV